MVSRGQVIRARQRVRIGELYLDRVDLADVMQQVISAIEGRALLHVVTANLQFLGIAARDQSFARAVNSAGLVVPDGVPLLWLSRLSGAPLPERITGHDLLHHCAATAAARGYSLFFLGGSEEVVQEASRRLVASFPGLRIAGSHHGRFRHDGRGLSPADEYGALEAIRACQPDILFVALGCPKQEMWIHLHQKDIHVPVCIGVGGVLDVLSGNLKRAPAWMQRSGLEWLYRLKQEPGRLWKRYLAQDTLTAFRLARSLISQRTSMTTP